MKMATDNATIQDKGDINPVSKNKIASLLTPCLVHLPTCSVELCEKETESLLSLGKELTKPLLESLSKRCIDLYEINEYMRALLDDNRYQECHHFLLLLYSTCRQATLGCVALFACCEELLIPYMWGVESALENYLNEQDALYSTVSKGGRS